MTEIYARDLRPEILTDGYLGRGFEKLLKEAEEQECELIVGTWCKPHLEKLTPSKHVKVEPAKKPTGMFGDWADLR